MYIKIKCGNIIKIILIVLQISATYHEMFQKLSKVFFFFICLYEPKINFYVLLLRANKNKFYVFHATTSQNNRNNNLCSCNNCHGPIIIKINKKYSKKIKNGQRYHVGAGDRTCGPNTTGLGFFFFVSGVNTVPRWAVV